MRRGGWHVLRDGAILVLARQVPLRFDVVAAGRFPPVRRERLATQIRQDLWRALQGQRGFSPVVEVTDRGDFVEVRAGGRVAAGRFDRAGLEARIEAVLAEPRNRARWLRCAGRAG
ncbi:hypothetical protein [Tropicimonas aquimaris]|uniref:Uncharacterized protein n=1 Tax=Tropicimonas aquimaris TaxID=914152 RepID=A0ABW3IS37_9RHOB